MPYMNGFKFTRLARQLIRNIKPESLDLCF